MAYADTTYLKAVNPNLSQGSALLVYSIEDAARYIDGRLAEKFGLPLSTVAAGLIVFGSNPSDGHTVTIGSKTYRFKGTTAQANDVTLAATALETCINLSLAINQRGTGWYSTTTINEDISASYSATAASITLTARRSGTLGNVLALSSASAALTLTGFSGGAGDYPVLERINAWLASSYATSGQVKSVLSSGGGGQDYIQTMGDMAEVWIQKLLDDKMALMDISGIQVTTSSAALPKSSNEGQAPFADVGDPVYWDYDSGQTWNRF